MARRNKQRSQSDEPKGDEWLATYSDCITLLLTFFVLLYSMSSVNEDKLKAISAALQSVLSGSSADSILEFNMNNGEVPVEGSEIKLDDNDIFEEVDENAVMYEKIKKFVEEHGLEDIVEIREDKRGIVMQLRDSILFESGKAELIMESKKILSTIGDMLNTIDNNIVVEGHTDNLPINTYKYASNWELSAARAVNVVKYFVEEEKLSASRFTASGNGEYQPIVENNSEENRAKNRRVNILILAKKEG